LEEIASMFDVDDELAINRNLLTQKVEEIDEQIKRLAIVRDNLNHVANCPQPSHLECPSFQKLMKSAKRYLP
ncbi:MerR family DNA-binding protein, partial [Vibrio tubiashii]